MEYCEEEIKEFNGTTGTSREVASSLNARQLVLAKSGTGPLFEPTPIVRVAGSWLRAEFVTRSNSRLVVRQCPTLSIPRANGELGPLPNLLQLAHVSRLLSRSRSCSPFILFLFSPLPIHLFSPPPSVNTSLGC